MNISDVKESIADAENTVRWSTAGSINFGLVALTKAIVYLADAIKETMLKEK